MPENGSVPEDRLLDIDRTWHVLHCLLTRTTDEAPLPLGFIQGGTPIGEDLGEGEARVLPPAELADAAHALERISLEQLLACFEPDALGEHEVYLGRC